MAANDIGHIVLTAVEVLSIILFIAFGSGARGKAFRIYSIASILGIIAAGILTGIITTNMTAEVASTPWAGLIERVNIYGTMLWIAMLGVVLRRSLREGTSVRNVVEGGESRPTKRVLALVGSGHRGGATYTATRKFLDNLEAFGDVQGEIVVLSDYDIGICRGCKACFSYGEERCPLKDDRDVLHPQDGRRGRRRLRVAELLLAGLGADEGLPRPDRLRVPSAALPRQDRDLDRGPGDHVRRQDQEVPRVRRWRPRLQDREGQRHPARSSR